MIPQDADREVGICRIFVAVLGEEGSLVEFEPSDTLALVAARFNHDQKLDYINVETRAGQGVRPRPLNTRLDSLSQLPFITGDGSKLDPFIVLPVRAGFPEGGVGVALAGQARLWFAMELPLPLPPYARLANVKTGRDDTHDTWPVEVRVWDLDAEVKRALQDYPLPEDGPVLSLGLAPGTRMRSGQGAVLDFCTRYLLDFVNAGLEACTPVQEPEAPSWSAASREESDLPPLAELEGDAPVLYLLDGRRIKSFVEVKRPEVLEGAGTRSLAEVYHEDLLMLQSQAEKPQRAGGSPSQTSEGRRTPIISTVNQAVKHFHLLAVQYGIITDYFTTWLVKCEAGAVYVSRGFSYASTNPSARQAAWLLTHLALRSESGPGSSWETADSPPLVSLAASDSAVVSGAQADIERAGRAGSSAAQADTDGSGRAGVSGAQADTDGSGREGVFGAQADTDGSGREGVSGAQADIGRAGRAGSSAAQADTDGSDREGVSGAQADTGVSTGSSGGSDEEVAWDVSPPAVPFSELRKVQLGSWLPTGMTGAAASGRMYGEKVVVKWVQPEDFRDYDAEYLTALLLHEIRVYQRLKELQGVVIPKLVAHGRWHNGKYVLVTSLIQGRHVDVEQHPEDAELVESAVAALREVHQRGVLHGDLGPANVLVVPACADSPERPPRVMLIDFNMSHFSCDEDDQEDEMDVLRALFSLPSDGGAAAQRKQASQKRVQGGDGSASSASNSSSRLQARRQGQAALPSAASTVRPLVRPSGPLPRPLGAGNTFQRPAMRLGRQNCAGVAVRRGAVYLR